MQEKVQFTAVWHPEVLATLDKTHDYCFILWLISKFVQLHITGMHSFKVVEKYVLQYACLFNLFPLGALSLESGTGMHHSHDPPFSGQSVLPSLQIYHQCAAHVHPIFNFQKKKKKRCIFSLVSGEISDLKTKIFEIFLNFFKENPLPKPYFWKPVWHTPIKKKKKEKKVVCPLVSLQYIVFTNILIMLMNNIGKKWS